MEPREAVLSSLQTADRILLTTHISPDADAIGSVFGLALGLERLGKHPTVYLAGGVPDPYLCFVPDIVPWSSELPSDRYDVALTVDCSTKKRIGPRCDDFFGHAPVSLNIDHHVSNHLFAQTNYVCDRASTAEIIFDLLEELRAPFDHELANLLFAGLSGDTGSFRFDSATEQAFSSATALIRRGAQPTVVADRLYFQFPLKALRLRALALADLRLFADGKVALTSITRQMFEVSGADACDTEGVVDEVRSLWGVLVAVSIREMENGWKASLRSKDERVDVNEIASVFSGGGHKMRAGCTLIGTQQEAESQILAAIEAHLKQLS